MLGLQSANTILQGGARLVAARLAQAPPLDQVIHFATLADQQPRPLQPGPGLGVVAAGRADDARSAPAASDAAGHLRGRGRGDDLADVRLRAAGGGAARARARGERVHPAGARARLAARAADGEDLAGGAVRDRGRAGRCSSASASSWPWTGAASRCGWSRRCSARPGSARSGVAIGGSAREVRAASLFAFLLSLPIAVLALVPSGATNPTLYDIIRVISAIFPFRPALDAMAAALSARRDRAAAAAPGHPRGGLRGVGPPQPQAIRVGLSCAVAWRSPRPACAGCGAPARCATSCARPTSRRGT